MVTSEWLVVDSNYSGWWFQKCVCFSFHIWDIILPIDKLIFFKMAIAPPTRHWDSWTIDSSTATLVGDILWFFFHWKIIIFQLTSTSKFRMGEFPPHRFGAFRSTPDLPGDAVNDSLQGGAPLATKTRSAGGHITSITICIWILWSIDVYSR